MLFAIFYEGDEFFGWWFPGGEGIFYAFLGEVEVSCEVAEGGVAGDEFLSGGVFEAVFIGCFEGVCFLLKVFVVGFIGFSIGRVGFDEAVSDVPGFYLCFFEAKPGVGVIDAVFSDFVFVGEEDGVDASGGFDDDEVFVVGALDGFIGPVFHAHTVVDEDSGAGQADEVGGAGLEFVRFGAVGNHEGDRDFVSADFFGKFFHGGE